MALIKCLGCGHDVSDKASVCPHCGFPIPQEKDSNVCKECGEQIPDNATVCPNCGCPTENVETVQEELYDEEPPKKKWWIWALAALLLCLIGGGGYYLFSEQANEESNVLSKKGDNSIVEITPDFINSIQKYDILGVFSEGYAAVCNKENHKWGYINTKGEEVIPTTIVADYAGRFSDGMAVVMIDHYNFCVIDNKGKTLFQSQCDNYMCPNYENNEPYYIKGKLYVLLDNFRYGVWDNQGKRIDTVSEEEAVNFYKQNCSGKYTIFEKDGFFGLKDSSGNIILPAKYGDINSSYYHGITKVDFNNGVVRVCLIEYGGEDNHGYIYGYADLKGNDTFTKKNKEQGRESKDSVLENNLDETQEELYEDEIEDNSSDWLQGRWVGEADGYPMEVIIDGNNLIHKIGGRVCYNGSYDYNGDMLIYDNATAFWPVDKDRQVLTYDGKAMRKESGSSSYSSSSSSSYSSGSSRESSYRFSSAYDVMGYLSDKSFYNGDRCLRIRENGVWFNDYCATGAPYVQRFESYKALVRAVSSMGPTYGYIIDPVNNTVTDDMGDVFRLR